MTFYETYLQLCAGKKVSPSAAAAQMGLSKTTVNRWKNGGGATDATALKVANYFGITVDELKNGIKNAPAEQTLDKKQYNINELHDSLNAGSSEELSLAEMLEFYEVLQHLPSEQRAYLMTSAKALRQEQSKP